MKPIFISYSRTDEIFVAAELVPWLESRGIPVWIDRRGITPGEQWRSSIDQAIRDADAVLLIVTPASMRSDYVLYEWAYAMGAGIPVLPLIKELAKGMHGKLNDVQHLDLTSSSPYVWEKLETTLKQRHELKTDTPRQMGTGNRPKTTIAVSRLLRSVRDTKASAEARTHAVRILGDMLPLRDEVSQKMVRDALVGVLFTHSDAATVRSAALAALIASADDELISALPALLRDNGAGVRYTAVDAITRHFRAEAAPALLQFASAFRQNASYLYRRKALQIVRVNLDTPNVRDTLLSATRLTAVSRAVKSLIDGPDAHMVSMAKQIGYELGLITDSQV